MTTPARAEPAQALTERPQWRALQEHCGQIQRWHLRELFAQDPSRGERLVGQAAGLYLDYSKNRITDETIRLLPGTRRRVWPARTHPGDVPRRQDQRH